MLARVARPEKLKAELRIPEVLAKDVLIGMTASIDTRNGIVPGHVIRVAPSVAGRRGHRGRGARRAAPQGRPAEPPVDGTIEIERLPDVLYVGRPSFGQANSKIELFKVIEDGKDGRAGAGGARVVPPSTRWKSSRACNVGDRGDPLGHLGPGRLRQDPAELDRTQDSTRSPDG